MYMHVVYPIPIILGAPTLVEALSYISHLSQKHYQRTHSTDYTLYLSCLKQLIMTLRCAAHIAVSATCQYLTASKCLNNISTIRVASLITRTLPSTAALSTTASSPSTIPPTGGSYTSPYRDLFASMKNGVTSLGTDHSKLKPLAEELADIPRLDCGIPEHMLRFSTTCYGRSMLAPYTGRDEHKVTLKVAIKHIPLESELEHEIFLKIVGNRFVTEKSELRLSANQFASRIENKRHLCAMLDRIVNGTRLLAKDVFEQNQSKQDS